MPRSKRTTSSQILHTSDIAKVVGIHPNTVRLYEVWGFISPVPRSPSGYRLFSPIHLAQIQIARTALHGPWPGQNIRRSALALTRKTATGDFDAALKLAKQHLVIVKQERAEAETAARVLERWASGKTAKKKHRPLKIGEAAKLLHATIDAIRNWERNGLISVPRDEHSGYRLYGTAEINRLRVIQMLRQAGYSPMAILRMLLQLDQGKKKNLRLALDTPRPDEDAYTASDRWLSTLAEQEARARQMMAQLKKLVRTKQ
ncbi:MAG: MerR family transcriptional regulator [Chloroflexi bacterium]|nr:MerR family transcriptional regulator [Chloroflexota bacterium]